jgi:uncharacterized membrane protein YgdD (TMEM256/DUF423 family)
MFIRGNTMESRSILVIAAVFGGLSVVFGAFGSHSLKAILEASQLHTFEVAVKYQMYHALALGLVSLLSRTNMTVYLKRSAYFFSIGTIIFSGSLYLLLATGVKIIGAFTPIGGLCLILGWAFLIREGLNQPS